MNITMPERTASRMKRLVASMPGPKRGAALFDGTAYPRQWGDFIGNHEAVDYLRASCHAAKARGKRLEHTLIAAGGAGVGKSALSRLVAHEMGVGLLELQGDVDVNDALRALHSMQDGDILLLDEVHLLVSKSRAKAEWLLSLMQDGVIVTGSGVQQVPDITVLAATTDVQKLPETIISRFVVKPIMEEYDPEQAAVIAYTTAIRIFDHPDLPPPHGEVCKAVAKAGLNNPRQITGLLRTLRDSVLSGRAQVISVVDGKAVYDLSVMFRWSGVAPDGLDRLAQDYLVELSAAGKPLSERNIAALLGQPTPPKHTEKLLMQRSYIVITPKGREITSEGLHRTKRVLEERGLI